MVMICGKKDRAKGVAMRRWATRVSGHRHMGIPTLRLRDVKRKDMDEKVAHWEEDRGELKLDAETLQSIKKIGSPKEEENIRYLQNTMDDAILRSTIIHDYDAHN